MKNRLFFLIVVFLLAACSPQIPDAVLSDPTPNPETPVTTEIETAPDEQLLRIAFARGADPWIWTEEEGSRQLADGTNVLNVVISDDGQRLAFARDDTGELFAVNADGTDLQPLVSLEYLASLSPSAEINPKLYYFDFAPNSHVVYFTTIDFSRGGVQYDLHQVDADNPNPVQLFASGEGGIFTFSPDGQWMALFHPEEVVLARPDGSEIRVAFSFPEGSSLGTTGPEIIWAEDSSGFSMIFYPDTLNPYIGELWFYPIEGEPIRRYAVNNVWGFISPDGQRVAYATTNNPSEIHILDENGVDTLYGSFMDTRFYNWAPDSTRFVLSQQIMKNNASWDQLFLCAPGEEPVQLVDGNGYANPVYWASDDLIVYFGDGGLRWMQLGEPSALLDGYLSTNVFDFTLFTP